MKFHEIQLVGKFWMHSIPVLTTWTVDDVGRMVFVESENSVYYGGNTVFRDWINISGHFIDEGDGVDPDTGMPFLGRSYNMTMHNGNIRLYY
jgi:hypothetical protein